MTPWYPILAVLVASLVCAYLRTGLRTWTIAGFVALFAAGWLAGSGWLAQAIAAALFAAVSVPLNNSPSKPTVPASSATRSVSLSCGVIF